MFFDGCPANTGATIILRGVCVWGGGLGGLPQSQSIFIRFSQLIPRTQT
jgi:hypothetical protein